MKRTIIYLSVTSIFLLMFFSCYYDNEEALYPSLSTTCDTTNITYSVTIVTMMSNNCLSCHSHSNAASSGGNIHLETYDDVVLHNVAITGSIKHLAGFIPMPYNTGEKIKDCYITQFDIWVRNGMPNN